MTISKIEYVNIVSTTSEGFGGLQYDIITNKQQGNITLKWLGGSLSFSSVADYTDFINNVVIPLTNIVNSPSGSGSGFVAITQGVPGSDVITN